MADQNDDMTTEEALGILRETQLDPKAPVQAEHRDDPKVAYRDDELLTLEHRDFTPSPVTEQAPPTESEGDVWLLVLEDMEERRQHGIREYGTPLQPHNGRDALIDAYQETLDLAVYLRQQMAEDEAPRRRLYDIQVGLLDLLGMVDAMPADVDVIELRTKIVELLEGQ